MQVPNEITQVAESIGQTAKELEKAMKHRKTFVTPMVNGKLGRLGARVVRYIATLLLLLMVAIPAAAQDRNDAIFSGTVEDSIELAERGVVLFKVVSHRRNPLNNSVNWVWTAGSLTDTFNRLYKSGENTGVLYGRNRWISIPGEGRYGVVDLYLDTDIPKRPTVQR